MFSLTISDFLFVALISFIVTVVISKRNKTFKKTYEEYDFDCITKIKQGCYNLFPKDCISFNGEMFLRGASVEINTQSDKIVEGIFMGKNNDDIICILTNKYVIAYKLEEIQNIKKLK